MPGKIDVSRAPNTCEYHQAISYIAVGILLISTIRGYALLALGALKAQKLLPVIVYDFETGRLCKTTVGEIATGVMKYPGPAREAV